MVLISTEASFLGRIAISNVNCGDIIMFTLVRGKGEGGKRAYENLVVLRHAS